MAFSPAITELVWNRSNQMCECTRPEHGHTGRCNRPLVWENRCADGVGGWEQRHIDPAAGDTIENSEALCYDCFTRIRRAAAAESNGK